MTQTLRRERKQKFLEILKKEFGYQRVMNGEEELKRIAELLADAAVSESERRTDETFGEYHVSPIYKTYEENIGIITPMLADQLKEIEAVYPEGWFEDAVKEALKANVRKLNYVVTILDRWKANGRSLSKPSESVKREEGKSSGYFA